MISKKDQKYLDLAESASRCSTHKQFKIGAVVAKSQNILSVGHNKEKTHPLQKRYNQHRGVEAAEWSHLHAELDAMLKVKDPNQLVGATLYISRSYRTGGNALARPCEACMEAAQDFGIKTLVYTTDCGIAKEYVIVKKK